MALRFKLDENITLDATTLLGEAGHEAHTVLQERLGGRADPQLLNACRGEVVSTSSGPCGPDGVSSTRSFSPSPARVDAHPSTSYHQPMDDSVRWTVKVSPNTDDAVRAYLGRRGRSARARSRLVEEALRAQIFEKSVERVKRMTARVRPARLQSIVREALRHARRIR